MAAITEMPRREELGSLARARGNVYKFLASCYLGEPSVDQIETLLNPAFQENLLQIVNGPHVRLLEDFARSFNGNHSELQVEYNSLFVVPLAKYVKPYESAYRQGLAGAGISREVARYYRSFGAEVAEDYSDLPDHLGPELDFMHFLCERESENWAEGKTETATAYLAGEKGFLEHHLTQWLDQVCQEVQIKSETGFYRALAAITRGFVYNDQNTIRVLLEAAAQP